MISSCIVALVAAAGAALAQTLDEQIAERIAPPSESCMAGEACAATVPAAVQLGGAARSGKAIYTKSCSVCHSAGVAGAPKYTDVAAWAPRITKGIDTLYTHAINGFNAMPAKGLCMDCSETEVKAAVDYMVEGSE